MGFQGRLPWKRVREDMDFFRSITHFKHIVMGYNTWKTLPRLPYRTTVVVSRKDITTEICLPQERFIDHILEFENVIKQEVIVIGGSKLLTPELIQKCSIVYHTTIKGTFPSDVYANQDSMAELKTKKEKILLDTTNCIIREYT